ncbi:GNAT family N-acetyltransferase [Acholeplasma granularum]|uniref:GNAT family N-acetyltransferase n=1 Tax=Acholeplasma granularum TaxID=264635 RepID=UPI00047219DD|nr:GNAT family N-acetyltransferase [Acholeplasma granularum]
MNFNNIIIDYINVLNSEQIKMLERSDVSENFVDSLDSIKEFTDYSLENNLKGHTFIIKYKSDLVGVLLIVEGIHWETDPKQLYNIPFYRIMDFIINKNYRGYGIGSYVLEEVISRVYNEFGERPVVLGVHKDNIEAEKFYLKHKFIKTEYMDGDDYYFIRSI